MPNTDFSLGDCSYLDSCRHMDSCKYVHYQIDHTDLRRIFFKLQKVDRNPAPLPINDASCKNDSNMNMVSSDKKKGWIEFSPLPPIDHDKLRREKIEKLRKCKTAQWINCNLQNFDLDLLV